MNKAYLRAITTKLFFTFIALLVLWAGTCSKAYAQKGDSNSKESESETISVFSLDDIPAYSDNPVYIVNDNVPFFGRELMLSFYGEAYSELDSLGRCGITIAMIGKDTLPSNTRIQTPLIRPSGWKTTQYNGLVDGNYLYNRCHLIAFQLTGENDNERNLITGTRYMNTEGMRPFEEDVRFYVSSTGNHVLYRVTPVFEDNNLVASGVLIEAQSVEDDKLKFNVFCYNVQPGVIIDYKTGESRSEDDSFIAIYDSTPSGETETASRISDIQSNSIENQPATVVQFSDPNGYDPIPADVSYVGNKKNHKLHKASCESALKTKNRNREYFYGNKDEAVDSGYPEKNFCKICKP
ncbi:MAG: DNA/RNA non-specific endonuclease [Lachnospiraceae bacterium]|nr:DNA/RNA non-specific endonuclease [Lachnospiraceae bacterium]